MAERFIYHITHLDNLPGILDTGGLQCKNDQLRQRSDYRNIAHANIQDRRTSKTIACGPGGNLHDYVPFYFCVRSPMLYAIHRGVVEGYDGPQSDVIYLVSSIEQMEKHDIPFVFTDGHGTVALTAFYDDLKHLDRIDWKLMEDRYWHDTLSDGDRKRRRQAEFLIHTFCPWDSLLGVAVYDENIKAQVEYIAKEHNTSISAHVRRKWYY